MDNFISKKISNDPLITCDITGLWHDLGNTGRLLTLIMDEVDGFCLNPVLAGCYPDPAICRRGEDYYLVCSSFVYYPGLPIFHSRDLVTWKQIGHAMNRPGQLPLTGLGVSQGLYAPSICFHNDLFYIVCTLVDTLGNFVITAKDPGGSWSNPVALPSINGFDPSIFIDDNGKAYILYNSIPPGDVPLHWGHRTIRINEFDINKLEVISEDRILINGGTDMASKPIWIEAPHIIKKEDWLYLICAEGGTGFDHSEVVFRSRSMDEPFIPYDGNPILTQRHLDPNRKNPVTTAGHADFVETPGGKWYAVFLACRPYKGDHYNTGRETFLAPVEWSDGWPHINPQSDEVPYRLQMPASNEPAGTPLNGNYFFHDNFSEPQLDMRYVLLRTPLFDWYKVEHKENRLVMQLQPVTIAEKLNPSFIGFRQTHLNGYAAVSLRFKPATPNEQAGLVVFQNEAHYYFLCRSLFEGHPVVALYRGPGNLDPDASPVLLARKMIGAVETIALKVEANGDSYAFFYASANKNWKLVAGDIDASFLSTCTAGGFVGCVYGMYATSNGQHTENTVFFNWFENLNDDEVYREPPPGF